MGAPLRVLMVEDSEDDAALLVRELRRGGYDVEFERVDTAPAMRAALDRAWDLIVSDYTLPHFNGLAALDLWKTAGLDMPFLIVSGSIGEETAVAAMKAGANDYLMKDNLSRLVPAIQRGLAETRVRQERRRAEETIHQLAYYDVLTKLPNRILLRDQLQHAIRSGQDEHTPVALLLMDLDRFKEINDTLGHPHGDRLLEQIGPRVQAASPASATVARLGGDEFAMVVPAADARQATLIAEKILRAIEEPFTIEGLPLAVEASIGIAIAPDHGVDPDRLIQCADVAMYLAKAKRSGHVIYQPDLDQHSPRRLALFGELRHAIDRKQLFLLYQPKIDLPSGRLTGVEALIRWKHPEHGIVPPDEFIPVAERSGLIKPLTLWVLESALGQCRAWQQAGLPLSVAVNLSARNLHDLELPEQVARHLRASGVAPASLELEITESVVMSDPARAMDVLTRLSALGAKLSIDDFGTGYSSLGYLKRLPVHQLKIDKSFIIDLARNSGDTVIVRSTIELAHNLGLTVVAEGVETPEVRKKLIELRCDSAQGYGIGRPMAAEDVVRWLDAHRLDSPLQRAA